MFFIRAISFPPLPVYVCFWEEEATSFGLNSILPTIICVSFSPNVGAPCIVFGTGIFPPSMSRSFVFIDLRFPFPRDELAFSNPLR